MHVGVFFLQMIGGGLCKINRAVLTASAPEIDAKVREFPFQVIVHRHIDDGENVLFEFMHGIVLFQIVLHGLVAAVHCLIGFQAAGIGQCATVEDKAAAVRAVVLWDPFFIRKTAYHHC